MSQARREVPTEGAFGAAIESQGKRKCSERASDTVTLCEPGRTHPHTLSAEDNTHTPSPPRGGPGPQLRAGTLRLGSRGPFGLFPPLGKPSPSSQHCWSAARPQTHLSTRSGGHEVKKDPFQLDQITLWKPAGWQEMGDGQPGGSCSDERSAPLGSPTNPPRLTWN